MGEGWKRAVTAARKTQLHVYGWQGYGRKTGHWNACSREIVAARSKAEAARLAGYARPAQMFNLSETGNAAEIEQAMSDPRVVFWREIDTHDGWTRGEALNG